MHILLSLCIRWSDQKSVVYVCIDVFSMETEVGSDRSHALGEDTRGHGEAKWKCLEAEGVVAYSERKKTSVFGVNADMEIGILEDDNSEPVPLVKEGKNFFQSDHPEYGGKNKTVEVAYVKDRAKATILFLDCKVTGEKAPMEGSH